MIRFLHAVVVGWMAMNASATDEFAPLFDGKSLEGWTSTSEEHNWTIENGEIVMQAPGGAWLRTQRTYTDFELKLEFMLPDGGNSGVALRAMPAGNPAFSGMEIQIYDTHGKEATDTYCGSVYAAIAPSTMAVRPAGEWNDYHITLVGNRISVTLNGEQIIDNETLDERGENAEQGIRALEDRAKRGFIGLQNYGDPVRFRNIRIRDLTPPPSASILLFTRTEGYRHGSIAAGVAAIRELADTHNFQVFHTENDKDITPKRLAGTDVVIFLNTTGDVLDAHEEVLLRAFIEQGGGFVGIHAAADTEYDWQWYGRLAGAYFQSHPQIQEAKVLSVDRDHPATSHLPERWVRTDEWYNYRDVPGGARILLTLDTDSYEGSTMSPTHPIAWCHEIGKGRSFYTGGGHTVESYSEKLFRGHLLGAIRWAAGMTDTTDTESQTDDD